MHRDILPRADLTCEEDGHVRVGDAREQLADLLDRTPAAAERSARVSVAEECLQPRPTHSRPRASAIV
jgi:hypothetical protein